MRLRVYAYSFIFLLATVPTSFAYAFDVYVHARYKNQPNLSQYDGVKTMAMISAQQFWRRGEDRQLLPSKERVIKYVAGKHANYIGLLAIDIEHWPLTGSDAQAASRVEKFITLWEWVKSAAPKARLGYYGVVPTPAYAQTLVPSSHPLYIGWQQRNDRAQALADRVDVFFPSLYTVSSNQVAWVQSCVAKARETRRMGNGKPMYMFINPRYHSNAYEGLAFKTVPKDYIALQLKTIKEQGANGVVIWAWNNAGNEWNENLPWWQATKEFLGIK